tara:strand:- start:134 stop:472 length:339 start_codon:yes stop_codon:yes gene_type:complete
MWGVISQKRSVKANIYPYFGRKCVIETAKERKARQKEKIAWYIKWFSSIIVMFAMAMRATGEPQLAVWDLYLSTVGIFGWLIVSLLWKDRALILLNGVGGLILLSGIFKSFI